MHLKINWGWSLLIVYLLFTMITVGMMYITTTVNNDTVVDNYYEAELAFQNRIDKEERSNNLPQQPEIDYDKKFVTVTFPEMFKADQVQGRIHFYRPSDKERDITVPVSLNKEGKQVIPHSNLERGKWIIELDWKYQNITYYDNKNILLR